MEKIQIQLFHTNILLYLEMVRLQAQNYTQEVLH